MNEEISNLDKKFYSIGDAAKLLNLDQHVLRFWESKFPDISPIRKKGNRRYYRKEDIEFLYKIKELLYDKSMTIKGVQKLLNKKSKDFIEEAEKEFKLTAKELSSKNVDATYSSSQINKVLRELRSINDLILNLMPEKIKNL